ncbi:MAG: flagellar motor protein [Glaciimonas sp.]|nr:flagellar motor protein [Glaciimonas sp.]
MDWGSLAGVLLAFSGIIFGQMLEGGRLDALMQPAAFVIVFIGTLGAVLLQTRLSSFLRGVQMVKLVFFPPLDDRQAMARDIYTWSATARREGFLKLESYMDAATDTFVVKGLRLVIDGFEPGKIREILECDVSAYEMRERQAIKIWEAAGGYSPTIGILGAVLGLIHVMENLSDPSKLGGGIAVAFVATIYGVGLANLVFLPIGHKLKTISGFEVRRREMLIDVFSDIATGDNARVIEERVEGYLK